MESSLSFQEGREICSYKYGKILLSFKRNRETNREQSTKEEERRIFLQYKYMVNI